MNINEVRIIGTICSEPYHDHTIWDDDIYLIYIGTKRKSGYEDILPVKIKGQMLCKHDFKLGQRVELEGSLRSYEFTRPDGQKGSKLYIFPSIFKPTKEEEDENLITIAGYVYKFPDYRITLTKREVTDTTLAVYRYENINYIPVIGWGRNARYMVGLDMGEYLKLSGRIQSREYQKIVDGTSIDKVAYEVSVSFLYLE